jgi:hypothetical protein
VSLFELGMAVGGMALAFFIGFSVGRYWPFVAR